jgi:hypothetical protein
MKTVVTEREVKAILLKRAQVESLKKRAKEIQEELTPLEDEVMASLRLGAKVEGRFAAFINVVKGRSSPSWKKEWEKLTKLLGRDPEKEENALKAEYPAKSSEELDIKVPEGWEFVSAV